MKKNQYVFYYGMCPSFKDLSMMYRALWDRRHEGATRISQCTDVSEWPEWPDYDMNYLVLIRYEAEICKRSSEAGGGESSIVENLCMVL